MRIICLVTATAAACLLVASAGSSASTKNLVRNGGAELGPGAKDASSKVRVPGWRTTGDLTAVLYTAGGGFPDASVSTKIGGGQKFFTGGPATALSTATQTVRFTTPTLLKQIDRGAVKATLSGYLGGYLGTTDAARVDAIYRSASGARLGSVRIGPVTPAQRASQTVLLARKRTVSLPKGTRSADVVLTVIRVSGSYNDGYADNISLTLEF